MHAFDKHVKLEENEELHEFSQDSFSERTGAQGLSL
jgi:hypothetical protein